LDRRRRGRNHLLGAGREASIALLPGQPPSDATIVGIVDTVDHAAAKPARRKAERG